MTDDEFEIETRSLLMRQNELLREQNQLLAEVANTLSMDVEEMDMKECKLCNEKLPEEERRNHLVEAHGAPREIELGGQFE